MTSMDVVWNVLADATVGLSPNRELKTKGVP